MLQGMKLLKMYGWEEMFSKAIEAVRKLEMSFIFSYNGCYGFSGKYLFLEKKHFNILLYFYKIIRIGIIFEYLVLCDPSE